MRPDQYGEVYAELGVRQAGLLGDRRPGESAAAGVLGEPVDDRHEPFDPGDPGRAAYGPVDDVVEQLGDDVDAVPRGRWRFARRNGR